MSRRCVFNTSRALSVEFNNSVQHQWSFLTRFQLISSNEWLIAILVGYREFFGKLSHTCARISCNSTWTSAFKQTKELFSLAIWKFQQQNTKLDQREMACGNFFFITTLTLFSIFWYSTPQPKFSSLMNFFLCELQHFSPSTCKFVTNWEQI